MTDGPGEHFLCQVCVNDGAAWVALAQLSPSCVLAEPEFRGLAQERQVGHTCYLTPCSFQVSLLCVEQQGVSKDQGSFADSPGLSHP